MKCDNPVKILITGAKGMLGRTLVEKLNNFELIPTDLPETDITDSKTFDSIISKHRPDVVIHCAAMTAVNNCESQIDLAYKINAIGSANVAAACNRYGSRLIAFSTDYVFDGEKDSPYNEFDSTNPKNIYGKSKCMGEELIKNHCPNHVIARISWLYGPGGPSFVHTMLELADGTRSEIKVVDDQRGNPTSTIAVADALLNIILRPELVGTFHLTCEGGCSWYDFACQIFFDSGIEQRIVPCSSEEFPTPALRPVHTLLDKMALRLHCLPKMPDWRDALNDFFKQELL